MENDCVRFAHEFKIISEGIPQFSIFNCEFSIMQLLDNLQFGCVIHYNIIIATADEREIPLLERQGDFEHFAQSWENGWDGTPQV